MHALPALSDSPRTLSLNDLCLTNSLLFPCPSHTHLITISFTHGFHFLTSSPIQSLGGGGHSPPPLPAIPPLLPPLPPSILCSLSFWPFPFSHLRLSPLLARDELHRMLNEDELRDSILLVFANKQDLPNAMSAAEMTDKLGLHGLRHRQWYVRAHACTVHISYVLPCAVFVQRIHVFTTYSRGQSWWCVTCVPFPDFFKSSIILLMREYNRVCQWHLHTRYPILRTIR